MRGWIPCLVASVACTEPSGGTDAPRVDPPTDLDSTPTNPAPDTGGQPSDTAGPSSDSGPTDTGTPGFDCTILPPPPAAVTTLTGFSTAEDFDFDDAGYAVSIYDGNLVGKNQAGNVRLISPNVSNATSGTRVLASGDWVVNDVWAGVVQRIDATTGAKSVLVSGLVYPNGLEIDGYDQVYVADQTQGIVVQVDANTGYAQQVASGLKNPNGVILSPDGSILYVGSFGGGAVYAIDRIAPGLWDTPRKILQTNGSDGGFDGIHVDACGNVYITEYIHGNVWRITPDGQQKDKMVTLPSSWIPNMRWGSSFGGWDPDLLYVADRTEGRLFALDVGIPGKKHVLAP